MLKARTLECAAFSWLQLNIRFGDVGLSGFPAQVRIKAVELGTWAFAVWMWLHQPYALCSPCTSCPDLFPKLGLITEIACCFSERYLISRASWTLAYIVRDFCGKKCRLKPKAAEA